MTRQRVRSVWDALEASPGEAANMRLRSELMIRLRGRIADWNITQAAAKRLGITQPRLNDLLRGRVDKFSLDALVGLVGKAGLVVRLLITPGA
jgi:predicted XRE-type DNA-binding protein